MFQAYSLLISLHVVIGKIIHSSFSAWRDWFEWKYEGAADNQSRSICVLRSCRKLCTLRSRHAPTSSQEFMSQQSEKQISWELWFVSCEAYRSFRSRRVTGRPLTLRGRTPACGWRWRSDTWCGCVAERNRPATETCSGCWHCGTTAWRAEGWTTSWRDERSCWGEAEKIQFHLTWSFVAVFLMVLWWTGWLRAESYNCQMVDFFFSWIWGLSRDALTGEKGGCFSFCDSVHDYCHCLQKQNNTSRQRHPSCFLPDHLCPPYGLLQLHQSLFVLVPFHQHPGHFHSGETLPLGSRYITLRQPVIKPRCDHMVIQFVVLWMSNRKQGKQVLYVQRSWEKTHIFFIFSFCFHILYL